MLVRLLLVIGILALVLVGCTKGETSLPIPAPAATEAVIEAAEVTAPAEAIAPSTENGEAVAMSVSPSEEQSTSVGTQNTEVEKRETIQISLEKDPNGFEGYQIRFRGKRPNTFAYVTFYPTEQPGMLSIHTPDEHLIYTPERLEVLIAGEEVPLLKTDLVHLQSGPEYPELEVNPTTETITVWFGVNLGSSIRVPGMTTHIYILDSQEGWGENIFLKGLAPIQHPFQQYGEGMERIEVLERTSIHPKSHEGRPLHMVLN